MSDYENNDFWQRFVEAWLFSSDEPVAINAIKEVLPETVMVSEIIDKLSAHYDNRGIQLEQIEGKLAFRTAADVGKMLEAVYHKPKPLSKVMLEILAIIAWMQPITRAEIEEVRGASLQAKHMQQLVDLGWIASAGRKESPGRPGLWKTTSMFLDAFGLQTLGDLPQARQLKEVGLLDVLNFEQVNDDSYDLQNDE